MKSSGKANRTNEQAATICQAALVVLTLIVLCAILGGCSELRPTSKSQQMTTFAFGVPAVTVVSTTTMSADNDGDDEHSGALSATNDVKPTVDADYNAAPQ